MGWAKLSSWFDHVLSITLTVQCHWNRLALVQARLARLALCRTQARKVCPLDCWIHISPHSTKGRSVRRLLGESSSTHGIHHAGRSAHLPRRPFDRIDCISRRTDGARRRRTPSDGVWGLQANLNDMGTCAGRATWLICFQSHLCSMSPSLSHDVKPPCF